MHIHQQSNKAVRSARPVSSKSQIQHKPGIATAIQPQSMSPAQMMFLQRAIGNRAIIQMFRQHSPEDKASEPKAPKSAMPSAADGAAQTWSAIGHKPIQRKIYVRRNLIGRIFRGKYRNETEWNREDAGTGDRNVRTMLEDDKSRYFDSQDEIISYANRETERIGYVKKTNTWIRLPDTLTVIGENHKETTLADVVKAVETDKYMYEGFTERPAEAAHNEKLANAMQQREDAVAERFDGVGIGPEKKSHYAESFYPKMVRAIMGLELDGFDLKGSLPEKKVFGMAIRLAASANPSALYDVYQEKEEIWRKTASEIEEKGSLGTLNGAMKVAGNSDIFTNFKEKAVEYAMSKIEEERNQASDQDRTTFEQHWQRARKEYAGEGDIISAAEEARDFSMFQHIKKAQADGYLLYGLGNLHFERLGELLRSEGINAVNMDQFMAEQRSEYPQS